MVSPEASASEDKGYVFWRECELRKQDEAAEVAYHFVFDSGPPPSLATFHASVNAPQLQSPVTMPLFWKAAFIS